MKYNKTKIIILSVLLALAVGTLIFAASARSIWSNKPDAEVSAESAAYAESAVLTASGDDIGISPTGWWEDLWNIAVEKNVYGTVHAGDKNTTVSSGNYTNKAFGYTAHTDFPQYQMKSPNASGFDITVLGTHAMWSSTNTNGWYYFRSYNPNHNGDYSKESSICLDTVKPQIQARVNGNSVANGTVTTSSSAVFSMLGSDDRSGVDTYWYTMNSYGGMYYQCYSSSTFSSDGVYTFYCKDRAGNVSDTVTVTKDTTAPTVRAYNGTSQISNGTILYAASARFEASDSTTGVSAIYIKVPNSSSYVNYGTAATLSTEGAYSYYARDNAGNQSSTYSFTIDRTAPTATLYSGTSSVSSGYYSASSYIKFTASDTNGCTIYIKKDSGSYAAYTSGTQQTAEGVYSFYAVDPAGNSTSTYTITLDRTAPVGTLYAGTTAVTSGKITNASYITYTATDNLALNALYVRKPNTSSYVTFTSGTQCTEDGTYYFYSADKSGNASSAMSIVLDRTKPTATITAGASSISSGGFTNAASVTFSASDATSGVSAMYVKLPNTSSYISYVAGTPFSTEGLYYFYATDVAGNTGDTVSVTLDKTIPTGTLTANGATVNSGVYTNKAFYYTATDSLSGISKLEIKRPNGAWETYTSGMSIAATSTNGLYSFRTTDKAGNVSAEMTINLVTTAPTITLYAGTTVVSSGTYTNSGYVAFTATGVLGATATLYVKMPDASSFTAYTSGTQLTKEGLYSFYATDNAGNTSATVTITLDVTKPAGTITAGGVTAINGSYTNKAFSFAATDNGSGINKCEIKRPNGAWETYTSGTSIAATSTNGLYSFRATDKAGNVSAEMTINLVTAVPAITLYAGTTAVPNGSYTNKSYVAFTVTAFSGATASLYVKMPDSAIFTLYSAGTQLSKEGKYEVYATDNAGNTSTTVTITLDTTKPAGTITAGGDIVSSGDYVNSAFKYSASDNVSGIAKLEILRPSGAWQTYGGEEITNGSGNGWYCFRATDNAGNVSAESKVYLLTSVPSIQLYVDEQPVANGTYTNLARISMSASGGASLTCYVKLPNASGFTVYNQYYPYTAAGRYEFYVEDIAGNKSGTFWIVVDRTAKSITQNGVSGNKTAGDVSLTWTDGNNTVAPIVSVTVNGIAYVKGSTIKTIDGGAYLIKSTDAAGNVWTATFTAARTEILSATLNKQYYETKNGAGNTYAFESYVNALAFAKERETALVRTGVWDGAVWDGGMPVDSIDSANAKNGTYYIYKKSGDKNTEVAYFTIGRLNAVIAEYAAESVKAYFWWEKSPAQSYNGNDLYTLKDGRVFIGNSVSLASHANYLIDGSPLAGLIYSGEGNHILTVFDDYGNSYEYVLKISGQVSKINYMVEGGGVFNTATGDRQYSFTKAVTVRITDNIDDYAMFYIKNNAGDIIAILSLGDEYEINKSGRYTIQSVNHGGVSEEIVFVLSLSRPAATFTDNIVSKRLEIRIQASYDTTAALSDIKIYRSKDNGLSWVLLTADDYGNMITVNRLFYEFNKDGLYRVVIEDNFRSGIDAVITESVYFKPAPVGTLYGVENGGHTNTAVRFVWTDEAYAYFTFNGEGVIYKSGTEITEQGEYVLEFRDENGYSKVYTFTIDLTKPAGKIMASGEAVQDGSYINTAFKFSAADDLSGVAYYQIKKPNGAWETYNGAEIAAGSGDGWYIFRAVDCAGNISEEIRVYLITSAPETAICAGTETVPSGTNTNKNYVTFTANSAASVVMYVKTPDADGYAVYNGAQLYGEGIYYFYAVDIAGNISGTISVTLDKTNPVGVILADSTNSYTNKAFSYSATDGISGVARYEIKRPNGVWEIYYGEEIAADSGDGWYAFRAVDNAGNISAESLICLLTVKPTVTIHAGTDTVQSGAYTNKSYVSFTVSAALSGEIVMYVRLPNSTDYVLYTAGAQLNIDGTYYVYATDAAGNQSIAVSVTLDTVSPIGTVTAGGAIIEDGGYINKAFSYSATDGTSGIARYEIKKPNGAWETYNGAEIAASGGDGWYTFRAVDRAGNISEEIRVYLITAAPETAICAGTETVQSGTNTNKNYVAFTANSVAGVTMYVKTPDTGSYAVYGGTQIYGEGTYYFYAVDGAGNVSATVSVTLDKSSPTGTITAGGAAVQSGSYTNKAFSYSATDSISGMARYEIKRPDGVWESYNGAEITADSGNGCYAFRAYDFAGNISAESCINLLTDRPIVQLYADESPINSGTYTNAARISMTADGGTAVTCYVKQPSGSFVLYNQYYTFSTVGRYEFYAIDQAGNQSGISVVIIDRTAKTVTLNGVSGGKTSGDVSLSWTDGDRETTAVIISVTVNGKAYVKGDVIKTIDGGAYTVKTVDAAGNVWTTTFTAARKEILSETLNKQYFETTDGSGKTYAFEGYDNAIAYATAREAALVRTAVWNSPTWDGGIPMDAIDSANAKNGTYYIYKKSGDKSTEVAYFTLERLNAVIADYADATVKAYYWWEKSPVQSYNGNDLYSLTANKIFVGSGVNLAGHANYLIDGQPYLGLTYSAEGEHELTVFDDYGNSYDYTIIIVRSAPDILYTLNGDTWNKAANDRQYALKEMVTLKTESCYGGSFAMYIIRDNAGEVIAILSCGDDYTISKSGRYTVQAVNHFGMSAEITFVLSLKSPAVTFTENADNKRLEVNVQQSVDGGVSIADIAIYKSVDGGLTWMKLIKDDYGRTINAEQRFYEFNKDGVYKAVIEDNFRSGIDAVTAIKDYTKPAPEGMLIGVDDGGYTNGTVKFTWTDEATARMTVGSKIADYISGTEITEEGVYLLEFKDSNGYSQIYTFVIDKTAPQGTLNGATDGGLTNKTVTLTFADNGADGALYKSGELVGAYQSNTEINTDGEYKIVLTDRAGNAIEYTFTIDTESPTATLYGVVSGGQTGGSVSLKNPNKQCDIKAYKDGAEFAYTFGDTLDKEGSYKIVLTDKAGNETVYEFSIVYAVNAAGTIVIVIVIVAVFGGIILVWLMRKRKVFKGK